MGPLRSVAAPHRHHQPDDLSASLQTGLGQRPRDDVGEKGVTGDDDIRTRHQNARQTTRPGGEELVQHTQVLRRQYGEPGQWRPLRAVEGRRDAPHATLAGSQLLLLLRRVLDQTVGGIGDDRVNGIRFPQPQPIEAIGLHQGRVPIVDGTELRADLRLPVAVGLFFETRQAVDAASVPNEQPRRVESQIGTDARRGDIADDAAGAVDDLRHGRTARVRLEDGQDRVAHLARGSPGSGRFRHASRIDVQTSFVKDLPIETSFSRSTRRPVGTRVTPRPPAKAGRPACSRRRRRWRCPGARPPSTR